MRQDKGPQTPDDLRLNTMTMRLGPVMMRRKIGWRGEKKMRDSNINSIKMRIPPFKDRNDAEAYLKWERKVELVFDCHYHEEKKIKLIAVVFTDYALVWWDQLLLTRQRNEERPISSWREMKTIMRKSFVLSYYYREMHQKLQCLT